MSAASRTLPAAGALQSRPGAGRGIALALTRRAFADARVRTIAFAYLFAFYAYIQPAGYRHTYPTLADRLSFARSFGPNKALRLFYGEPHDLLSVSGYTAWRVGGTLAIFAAVFGLLAAVRALRTEEDAGRMELVLAGIVGRRTSYLTAIAAIAAGILLLWAGEFARLCRSAACPRAERPTWRSRPSRSPPVFVGVGALSEPARADSPSRARARRRSARADVPAAGDRRHRRRRRLAALGDPARVGRATAPVHRAAAARAAVAGRRERAAARAQPHGSALRRDIGTGCLPSARQRRAAASAALLADRPDAAHGAHEPARVAARASACSR